MGALDPYSQPVDQAVQSGVNAYNVEQDDADLARKSKEAAFHAQLDALAQNQTTQAKQKALQTAGGEMTQWAQNPDTQGKPFHTLDPYSQSSLTGKYPEIASEIPGLYNQAQRDVTGNPNIGATLEPGQTSTVETAGQKVIVGKLPPDQGMRLLRTQAARMGITDLPPDASAEEIQDRMGVEAQKIQQANTAKEESAEEAKKSQEINQIKRLVQTNQQVKYYQAANANYDSIQKNVSKPVRTGADDAFLLQSAATMEAPGRSPTANDVKEFMRANGITGNLNVIGDRWDALINSSPEAQQKAGRLLSDALAQQIATAAKNSLETRRASLTEVIKPHVNRFEDIGEDPYRHLPKSLVDDVYQVTQPQAQGATSNQGPTEGAINHLKQHPELAPQFDAKYGKGASGNILK